MSWSKETLKIVEFAIVSIFGFGVALYLGNVFLQALPSGSTAYASTNSIMSGFQNAITQVLVPIISIVFVLFLYLIVKASGLLGRKHEVE